MHLRITMSQAKKSTRPVESWWNKYSAICGITQTRLRPGKYKDGVKRTIFLKCGHGFYTKALMTWIAYDRHASPTCPNCRRII